MIFRLLIIHNHYRLSSIPLVLHITTWDYLTRSLPDRFNNSPKGVKKIVVKDMNDLVQELWRTSRDRNVEVPFVAMRRLHKICLAIFEVCFNIIFVFTTAADLANKNLQVPDYSEQSDRIRAKLMILFDGYQKIVDWSTSKSKDLHDLLRFLPGIVVQKPMSKQGMADLYRIKPELLERLVKSDFEPLKLHVSSFHLRSPSEYYELDDYLSGFLQDRDRSQLYYCDPMLQHIAICRQFLSLLAGSNANDFG